MKCNIILIIIFVIIDCLNINNLWGENFHRRIIHHFQRSDYNPRKVPNIYLLDSFLDEKQLNTINSIKLNKSNCGNTYPFLSSFFGGNYSKKSNLYYNDFSKESQKVLDTLGNQIKLKLEKIIGKKLYLGTSSFRCCILRYEGKGSNFDYHYDTEPHNCFRTLFLFKKKGKIPPFVYYDKNKKKQKVNLELGDGIFFQGTKTYHGVDKTEDDNAERYMIGWQYSTDLNIKENSLCSKLRDASITKIISELLPHIILIVIIVINLKKYYKSQLSNIIIFLTFIVIIVSNFGPPYLMNSIGTHIKFSLKVNIKILLLCFISTFDLNAALILFNYLVLTEMFLPNKIINKSLRMVGFD